jgi:hypothetical protein
MPLAAHHELAPLQARAALATGWPTLHLDAATESAALAAHDTLVGVVGPVPQADLLEPSDDEAPWRLRVDLPWLAPETWDALQRALPTAVLAPGRSAGAQEAHDQLALLEEEIAGAVAPVDALRGGLCLPELCEEDPDPPAAQVATALVAAAQAVSPGLVRHPSEAVSFVRHRHTGRRGWRLTLPDAVLEGLAGDALAALRRDVVEAVWGVVRARRDADVALAPDLLWDPRLGFSVIAWRAGPPGPALPGDGVIGRGPRHLPGAVSTRIHALEVQVVPREPTDHDALGLDLSERLGPPLVGGPSRWVPASVDGRMRPVFVPTWRAPATEAAALEAALVPLADHPGVADLRVVPVDPLGLEEVHPFLDPCWRPGPLRTAVRWRDGLADRDRIVAAIPRDRAPADAPLEQALAGVLARSPAAGVVPRAVVDDVDRPGHHLRLPSGWLHAPALLAWVLDALLAADLPGVDPVLDLALPASGPEIALWHDVTDARPPTWVSCG